LLFLISFCRIKNNDEYSADKQMAFLHNGMDAGVRMALTGSLFLGRFQAQALDYWADYTLKL